MYGMECFKCKTKEGLTVGRTRYRANGDKTTQYICRSCNAAKKRVEINRNPTAARRAEANSRARYPEKVRARTLAKRHVPLQPCDVCGEKAHRHHEDYNKPLDVRFLCALHHKQLHQGVLI